MDESNSEVQDYKVICRANVNGDGDGVGGGGDIIYIIGYK
jgi:hypothetical protein